MWFGLLARFWPYLAGAALILCAGLYLHHRGYESGFAASEGKWQPRFAKAERELDAANARTRMTEAESNLASAESQRRIDETQKLLDVRTADYDGRLRSLSVRLSAASANRCEVPAVPGSSAEAAGASESDQRAAEVGSRIAGIGADCESDAARLAEWQRWYTEQRTIFSEAHTH